MTKKKKTNRRGMADHTADSTSKRRMRIFRGLNDVLDNEYDSTKLLIPDDVLDLFKGSYLKFTGNNPNPN